MKTFNIWHNLFVLGVTIMVISLFLLLYAWQSQRRRNEFKQNGVLANAVVTKKSSSKSVSTKYYRKLAQYRLHVSYWTAPLLHGGELVMTDISDFTRYEDWKKIAIDDKVEILYLPKQPKKAVLFSSLHNHSLPLAERYGFALVLMFIGGLSTLIGRIFCRI